MVRSRPNTRRMMFWGRKEDRQSLKVVNTRSQSQGFQCLFWSCFIHGRLGPLVPIDGTLNSGAYIDILRAYLLPEIVAAGNSVLFQQDNAPSHTSGVTMRFLADNQIALLNHPPQSPDLNPVEHLWAILKQKLYSDYPPAVNRKQLIDFCTEIWESIRPETLEGLSLGVKERYRSMIQKKGLWIY